MFQDALFSLANSLYRSSNGVITGHHAITDALHGIFFLLFTYNVALALKKLCYFCSVQFVLFLSSDIFFVKYNFLFCHAQTSLQEHTTSVCKIHVRMPEHALSLWEGTDMSAGAPPASKE